MDAERFDRIARALGRGADRRRVLAGLVGGALAGLRPGPLGAACPPERGPGRACRRACYCKAGLRCGAPRPGAERAACGQHQGAARVCCGGAGAPCGDDCGCCGGLGCSTGGTCLSDAALPTCSTQLDPGPPAQARTTVRDAGSGLAEIVVTRSENADTVVPPFTVGTTDPVAVTSTKIDQSRAAAVELRVTDVAGNQRFCNIDF